MKQLLKLNPNKITAGNIGNRCTTPHFKAKT